MRKLDGLVWRAVVFTAILTAGFTLQAAQGNRNERSARIAKLHAALRATPAAVCTDWQGQGCNAVAEVQYQVDRIAAGIVYSGGVLFNGYILRDMGR